MIDNGQQAIVDICYLIAAICFIFGLKRMSAPATARRGNQLAAVGMAIAIIVTFFTPHLHNIPAIIIGLVVGAAIGAYPGRTIKMTAMPQMVGILNGLGGLTAALVELSTFTGHVEGSRGAVLASVLGLMIGSISASGSAVAFLKLQEMISGRPITYKNHQLVNALLAAAMVIIGIVVLVLAEGTTARSLFVVLFIAALVFGVLLVTPIGGADMPVVIALLNSATGIAAALTGFVVHNEALVVAGALVGASGGLLTVLMARAMNRPVSNVFFGAFGGGPTAGPVGAGGAVETRPIREITAEDAAVPLAYAQRVIIVPGYGMAVAQAQHSVRELADVLQQRNVDVRYAIHPVAGRMPGHMNVLLAEANVPYDELYEMDDINDDFAKTDVALVIGANDVTNPAAREDKSSPIYGMPILNVDQAATIIVLKRSMKAGFAGIENELFYDPKTSMLFGDAKDSLNQLTAAVKSV